MFEFKDISDYLIAIVSMWVGYLHQSIHSKASKDDVASVKELQESHIEYIREDLEEIKQDLKEIRQKLDKRH